MLSFGAAQANAIPTFGADTSAVEANFNDAPQAQKAAQYAANLGAEVERMGISWKWVQPKAGIQNMRWTKYDRQIAAIISYGMRPMIMIHDAPYWAHVGQKCATKHCPPTPEHLDDWGVFAREVAKRYAPYGLEAIEVWNSPNTKAWWPTNTGPSPKQYASVYSWASGAVHKWAHENDLRIPVLFCSCGGNGFKDTKKDIGIRTFLQGFYAHVNLNTFENYDGVAVHAYPSKADIYPPEGTPYFQSRFLRVLSDTRDVRDAADAENPNRKIWFTEIGMSTTGPDESRFTPQEQRFGLVGALVSLSIQDNSHSDIGGMFVFTLIETIYSKTHPEEKGYGLLERGENSTLIPKPAYCGIRKWVGLTGACVS